MKIYIGYSNNFNFKEELYMPIINSKLKENIEFIFPHLTNQTFNLKHHHH